MKPDIGNEIQNRDQANDVFLTPPVLARQLIEKVPIQEGDVLCDAFAGIQETNPSWRITLKKIQDIGWR